MAKMQNVIFLARMLYPLSIYSHDVEHHDIVRASPAEGLELFALHSSLFLVELAWKHVLIENMVDPTRLHRCLHDRINIPKVYAISIISIV